MDEFLTSPLVGTSQRSSLTPVDGIELNSVAKVLLPDASRQTAKKHEGNHGIKLPYNYGILYP